MSIELKLNRVAQLLEKLLIRLEYNNTSTSDYGNKQIDSPTLKLMDQFINGIKTLNHLNSQIGKNNDPYFMTFPEVKKISGLSKATLWRMEKSGTFPIRRRLGGNTTRWLSTEVNQWVMDREKVF